MTTPARTPCPVIPPPRNVTDEPTRELLAALYEEGWLVYPATGNVFGDVRMEVVSPDHTRSLILQLADVQTPRLIAHVQDDRLPLSWATKYVRDVR